MRNEIMKILRRLSGGQPGTRVRIADLKRQLNTGTLDATLLEMQSEGRVVLNTINDPREITPADKLAAIDVCGYKRHIIYWT